MHAPFYQQFFLESPVSLDQGMNKNVQGHLSAFIPSKKNRSVKRFRESVRCTAPGQENLSLLFVDYFGSSAWRWAQVATKSINQRKCRL